MTIFGKSSKWTSKGSGDTSADLTLGVKHNPPTQHALSSDNDLLRLFFDRQGTDQCCNLFGCLPLRKLSKTLLTSPYAGVNNLEEQLSRPRVEDENGTVCNASCQIFSLGTTDARRTDGLGRQVTLECLVAKEYGVRMRP